MTTAPVTIGPASTLGELVVAYPELARLFEELKLDYCCGGRKTLAEAGAARGIPAEGLAAMVRGTVAILGNSGSGFDAGTVSLTALADHIERTHHAYLKDELPRLAEMSARVAHKHSHRDPRLAEVAETVHGLATEMFSHMQKEEMILFPLVRQAEAAGSGADLTGPVAQMEAEHDDAGRALERLRELTGGFQPDGDACNTHRVLLSGLARLEADLHQHVHKENNILFPRALALATA